MILPIIEKNSELYTKLTNSERKLANYISKNAEKVQYLSITSLAKTCNVAEATITRFCKKLNYSGYNELKIEIAKTVIENNIHTKSKVDKSESMQERVLNSIKDSLESTLKLVDYSKYVKAAKMFKKAKNVYCFGQGTSGVIAKEAWSSFMMLASNFNYVEDSHLQIIATSLCSKDDVILYFSYSGETREVLDTLKLAKKCGVKIILVTHYQESPAAKYSDIVLLCDAKETLLHSGSMNAKITQLYIIDMLLNEFSQQNRTLVDNNRILSANAISIKLL